MKKKLLLLCLFCSFISLANTEPENECEAPLGDIVKEFIAGNQLRNIVSVDQENGTLLLSTAWSEFSEEDILLAQENLEELNHLITNGEIEKFQKDDSRLDMTASLTSICMCADCPCNGGLGGGDCCRARILWFFCIGGYGNCN